MTEENPAGDPAPLGVTGQLRQQRSRLLLLNPGKDPVPLPEDWRLPDLLELVAPGGAISVCREPGGEVVGQVTGVSPPTSETAASPVVECVGVGVHNPGQQPILPAADGYMSLGVAWVRLEPGGFLTLHRPRPGEDDSTAIDLRQRVADWLESLPDADPSG